MMEFKVIPDFPKYGINEKGEVKNLKKDRLLKPYETRDGYLLVKLSGGKVFSLHRLVAGIFVPNPDNKPEVNHEDGNKKNNHYTNLTWSTRSENLIHARMIGLLKNTQEQIDQLLESNKKRRKFSDDEVRDIRYRYNNEISTKTELSKEYGITFHSVRKIVERLTYKEVV